MLYEVITQGRGVIPRAEGCDHHGRQHLRSPGIAWIHSQRFVQVPQGGLEFSAKGFAKTHYVEDGYVVRIEFECAQNRAQRLSVLSYNFV